MSGRRYNGKWPARWPGSSLWFWRSSPRSLPASILDALRQTAARANAEEEAIAPSFSRRRSGRARTTRARDPKILSAILACPFPLQWGPRSGFDSMAGIKQSTSQRVQVEKKLRQRRSAIRGRPRAEGPPRRRGQHRERPCCSPGA